MNPIDNPISFERVEQLHTGDESDNRFFVIAGVLYEIVELGLADGLHCVVEVYKAENAHSLGEVAHNWSDFKYKENFIVAYDFGDNKKARDEYVIGMFALGIHSFHEGV